MKKICLFIIGGFLMISGFTFGQNPRFHVIERINSTSCGECPCLDSVIYTCIIPAVPKTVVIQYHTWTSGLYCEECDTVADNVMSDHSEIRTDRDGQYYNYQFFKNIHQVCDSSINQIARDTVANIKIQLKSKSFEPTSRTVNFSADFTPYLQDISGTFIVNAVITEDKIIMPQQHMDTCGSPPDSTGRYPRPHSDVARKMAYTPVGDVLKDGNWPKTQTITRNFSLKLDSTWITANCNLILYVYKQGTKLCNSKMQQALKQSVTWPLGTSPGPSEKNSEIRIFPNPAGYYANAQISLPEQGLARISILDLTGRPVKKITDVRIEKDTYNVEFDLSGLQTGQYVFQVLINGRNYSCQFNHCR